VYKRIFVSGKKKKNSPAPATSRRRIAESQYVDAPQAKKLKITRRFVAAGGIVLGLRWQKRSTVPRKSWRLLTSLSSMSPPSIVAFREERISRAKLCTEQAGQSGAAA